MELGARVSKLHFIIGDSGLSSEVVGLGGIQGSADVGIVEGGEQLAGVDVRTFIEENTGDTAGDFGGDGGAAARGDVAAGVQQRFAAAEAGCRLLCHGYFHDGLLVPEGIDAAGETGDDDEQPEENRQALSPTAAGAVTVVNAQGTEVVYWGVCWRSHAFGDP